MPSNPALQGLASAKPQSDPSQGDPNGGQDLKQAAAQLLQDAVSQFGPEIVSALVEVLSSASATAGQPQGQPEPQQGF